MPPAADTDVGLHEFLAERARRTSDTRLALGAGGGLAAVVAALSWRPPGWRLLACVGVFVLAFGVWGIADRELHERGATSTPAVGIALRMLRALAAACGALAVLLLLLGVVGLGLGTWIS